MKSVRPSSRVRTLEPSDFEPSGWESTRQGRQGVSRPEEPSVSFFQLLHGSLDRGAKRVVDDTEGYTCVPPLIRMPADGYPSVRVGTCYFVIIIVLHACRV